MNQITKPELNIGEIYAGAIINPDGTGSHIILLTGDKDDGNWDNAMEWAKSLGGDLPNRAESALLFNQSKDQFNPEWYWTNEQHASDSSCAWCQGFDNGGQDSHYKGNELRARAVRRLAI